MNKNQNKREEMFETIEISKRFNNLPEEHRTTAIRYNIIHQISVLESEKRESTKAHERNTKRLNERIKLLYSSLRQLNNTP